MVAARAARVRGRVERVWDWETARVRRRLDIVLGFRWFWGGGNRYLGKCLMVLWKVESLMRRLDYGVTVCERGERESVCMCVSL